VLLFYSCFSFILRHVLTFYLFTHEMVMTV